MYHWENDYIRQMVDRGDILDFRLLFDDICVKYYRGIILYNVNRWEQNTFRVLVQFPHSFSVS